MRVTAPPRRLKSYVIAVTVTVVLFFHKWLYCFVIVVHCFITWNLRSTNFVGSGDDGFSLDLQDVPLPPEVDFTALGNARSIVKRVEKEGNTTNPVATEEYEKAVQFIAETEKMLAWGPVTRKEDMIIPPIIHHIVINMKTEVPETWVAAREACMQLHPDWTFMYWDDQRAVDFIRKEHGWFLETWQSYKYPIQKADSLRYLVLYTYGGTYLDMDLQCRRPLDAFRKFPFVAPAAHPVGISNGFMMTAPAHPFIEQLIQNLQLFNRWFISSYPTVMFSTGCMYVSSHHAIASDRQDLKVLGGENNRLSGRVTTPLFTHWGASSWHQGDARVFKVLGNIVKAIPIFGTETKDENSPEVAGPSIPSTSDTLNEGTTTPSTTPSVQSTPEPTSPFTMVIPITTAHRSSGTLARDETMVLISEKVAIV
ncbi:nucleotide-diphospho-sugar transferase [Gaertneriomyces semiglobifer]|nr:nucleotide-diphospho-sugar transferase [Gaertneriomyces semiglobifer]